MFLYRVAHNNFINDLTGTGAKLFGGRWNNPGHAVVYTSSTEELAILESLCHNTFTGLIKNFGIVKLEISDKASMNEVKLNTLPGNWRGFPAPPQLAAMGDKWLMQKGSLLMKVPSVIVPTSFNYLINPNHPERKRIKIQEVKAIEIDIRLPGNLRK